MSKYGVFSGPCFLVFGLNTGKYGPEKTPYIDTFHTVLGIQFWMIDDSEQKRIYYTWACLW